MTKHSRHVAVALIASIALSGCGSMTGPARVGAIARVFVDSAVFNRRVDARMEQCRADGQSGCNASVISQQVHREQQELDYRQAARERREARERQKRGPEHDDSPACDAGQAVCAEDILEEIDLRR